MCNDDDGMLIAKVVDKIYHIDRIAIRRNRTVEYKKPSMSTCRREIEDIISSVEYLIYPHLKNAFKNSKKSGKVKIIARIC